METQQNSYFDGAPKIGGWLLLFCIGIAIISPVLMLGGLIVDYSACSPLFDVYPGFLHLCLINTVLVIVISTMGIYTGFALKKIKPGAVKTAKIFLIFYLILTFLQLPVLSFIELPKVSLDILYQEYAKEAFRALIFFIVWFLYFKKSNRVKNTFSQDIGYSESV